MNKAALLTTGKKLNGTLHLMSVFDLEPSGVIIHAYNQINSKEYILPVTEMEVGENVTIIRIFLSLIPNYTSFDSWRKLDSPGKPTASLLY
jgi:hypothetical protein